MTGNAPLFSIWFGNFYRPAFDDRDFVDASMKQLKRLGFNTVELDSKDWQDFRDFFAGGEPSPYVAMQEYMKEAAHREGLEHMFLALYLNGDNLYPNIRFSPPVHGESVVNPDGSDGRWYRYWSGKARDAMTEHVAQLLAHSGEGEARITVAGHERIPLCSMWDPVAAPSFDADGIRRYTGWLRRRYGSIEAFNSACGTNADSFDALKPSDYWFALRFGEGVSYSPEDLAELTPRFRLWADNMHWRAEELTDYFRNMEARLHGLDPRLYLMPNLSQWSHFLNIDTSAMPDVGLCDLWDTANRGIDMAAIAPYVDMCHWFTLPVSMDGEPEPYAVSCQHAHMRALNRGREWLGGIYWGRFLYNDIYRFVSPEETVGSIIAAGARGIAAYGWCGLDDGGILHRMDDGFLDSLSRANAWAKRVLPLTGGRRRGRVAILFPADMALLEPLSVPGAAERRSDLLGLFRFCCDRGYAPELAEKAEVLAGLPDTAVLLIPADDCYRTEREPALEEALRSFCGRGGTVIHSAGAGPAELAFGIGRHRTENSGYIYRGEGGLLSPGTAWVPEGGEALARWCADGQAAVTVARWGSGRVCSFGFMPGAQYAARKAPHVPPRQRNNALYPFTHMTRNPLEDLLREAAPPDMPLSLRDVECAAFEHGHILVNHRSVPVTLINGQTLPGHGCAWVGAQGEVILP